jgi:uncharacterized caspase-like protein/WD40 repeat protein
LSYAANSIGVAFSKDGWLATTSDDGKVRLYDPDFKRVVNPDSLSGTELFGVAFSPDGKTVAVGYYDRPAVDLLDGHSLARQQSPNVEGLDGGNLMRVAWSSEGRMLFAGGRYHVGADDHPILAWGAAGRGVRRSIFAKCGGTDNTTVGLAPLPDGRLFVVKGNPCVMMLKPDGSVDWDHPTPNADFRGQEDTISVSADGTIVDFGYGEYGRMPLRLDLGAGELSDRGASDGRTRPRVQNAPNIKIENWLAQHSPTLNGKPLTLIPYETSRSYAIRSDSHGFVLGADWTVRGFDADGKELWLRRTPGVAWAVNISGDGRLVVAGLGDGTIRWYRMDDGRELLSLKVLSDKKNWVAWTPEGFYGATQGALGVLKWQVNRGEDAAADVVPVSAIPRLQRPEILPLVLQELDTVRALGIADIAAARLDVKEATHADEAPGQRLYILTIGIDNYGDKATTLHLNFADRDAEELANALFVSQGGQSKTGSGLYAKVVPQYLLDGRADKVHVFAAMDRIRQAMAADENAQDLAVILFSGHGAMVDGSFYLLPYGVDAGTMDNIAASAIWANEFQNKVAGLAQYGRVLVLIDACHAGAVAGDGSPLPSNADLLRQIAIANVSVLTSSSFKEVSFEDAKYDQHGAFTKALLDALGKDASDHLSGPISMTELAHYVSVHVPKLTGDQQHPHLDLNLSSDANIFVAGQ